MFNTVDALRSGSEVVKVYAQECLVGVSNGLPAYRSNVVVGFRNTVPGRANVVMGNSNTLTGNSNVIFGSNMIVNGSNNIIIGGIPDVTGSTVINNNNSLIIGGVPVTQVTFGSVASITRPQPTTGNMLDVNSNVILGVSAAVDVSASNNTVVGKAMSLGEWAHGTVVVGHSNSTAHVSDAVIVGRNNVITSLNVPDLRNNVCIGTGVTLTDCKEVLIIANNSTTQNYVGSSNVIIIGDNVLKVTSSACVVTNLVVSNTLTVTNSLTVGTIDIPHPTLSSAKWQLGTNSTALNFTYSDTGGSSNVMKFDTTFDTTLISFTGTHRCVFDDVNGTPFKGALVRSTGKITNLDGASINEASMEAIPEVALTTAASDVCVIGVYVGHESETDPNRQFQYGHLVIQQKRVGVPRALINSTGEGAVYAVGPVAVGDLLTTSDERGVAKRQTRPDGSSDRDVYSYTIAKATSKLAVGTRGVIGCLYLI